MRGKREDKETTSGIIILENIRTAGIEGEGLKHTSIINHLIPH